MCSALCVCVFAGEWRGVMVLMDKPKRGKRGLGSENPKGGFPFLLCFLLSRFLAWVCARIPLLFLFFSNFVTPCKVW